MTKALTECEKHVALVADPDYSCLLLLVSAAGRFWVDAATAYQAGNLAALRSCGAALTGLLTDMDALLGSHKGFLLGPVLERARSYALHSDTSSADEQQQLADFYEWNLRTQLTIWGTSVMAGDSEVSDYANKEWSGLISSFYLPRWSAWLERLEQDLLLGRPYNAAAWRLEVLMMTYRWINTGSTAACSITPSGSDSSEVMALNVSDAETEAAAMDQVEIVSVSSGGGSAGGSVFAGPVVAVQDIAHCPQGDPVKLSADAYERYGRLVIPATATGNSACAGSVVAAAAAAVVAGATVAAVAAANSCTASAAPVVEEVVA